MLNLYGFWSKFWEGLNGDEDTQDIEGLIFKAKDGKWVMVIVSPTQREPMVIEVNYNPWTGKELR